MKALNLRSYAYLKENCLNCHITPKIYSIQLVLYVSYNILKSKVDLDRTNTFRDMACQRFCKILLTDTPPPVVAHLVDKIGTKTPPPQIRHRDYGCVQHAIKIRIAFLFYNVFVVHISISYFETIGTPVLDFWWCVLWVSKPEWVLPYSLFAEPNVMYIPWDPSMVLHLLTSWWLALQPVTSPHASAEVGVGSGFQRTINRTEDERTDICIYFYPSKPERTTTLSNSNFLSIIVFQYHLHLLAKVVSYLARDM